jgi:hypothetical protein
MKRELVLTSTLLLACGPQPADNGTSDESSETTNSDPSSSESTTADPSTADPSATETDADETTTADTSDTDDVPACGNGQLDPGEQCDDALPGCAECMHACALEYETSLDTTARAWISIPLVPAAIPDGTGDLIVGTANAVHRVTADGTELWVQSADEIMDSVSSFLIVGDAVLVEGLGPGYVDAVYATFTLADGTQTGSTMLGGEGAFAGGIALVGDTDFLAAYTIPVEKTSRAVTVGRRALDGFDEIWSTTLSGDHTLDGYCSGLTLTSSGDIYLHGRIGVDDTTSDPWVAKVSASGEETWQRRPGNDAAGGYDGFALAVSPDPQGGIVVIAGRQYGNEVYSIGSLPAVPKRLLRLDGDGETTWELDLGRQVDADHAEPFDVQALADGRILVGGATVQGGAAHPWLAVLDAEGTLLCDVTVPHDSGLDGAIANFYADAEGELKASGWVDDGSTQSNLWTEDDWLARIE